MGHHPLPPPGLVERLAAAGCVAPEEEAAQLVAASADRAELEDLVGRRERGEPLAWITGTTRFCGRAVAVDPGVYVPRPQSEALARRAAELLVAAGEAPQAADLCAGSGAVGAHLRAAVPGAAVVAVDADVAAVRCARRNGVPAVAGDLGAPLAGRAFDVVVAVAPYVPTAQLAYLPSDVRAHEPRGALDGGGDGLDVVRRVVGDAARLLRPGGWLLVEVGGTQDRALAPALERHGFGPAAAWHDEDGDLRGLAARLAG